jgi:aspartyl-tRNA(Asn)/glutamyl-tRNA(Gln) amidotransferase subunit C
MALDLAQIRRIADLARIDVTDAEAQRVLEQLTDIFRMIERMQAVDTEGLEPMAHPLGGAQRLRDDVVTVADERAGNLANAPEQQDGLFLVPRVIE